MHRTWTVRVLAGTATLVGLLAPIALHAARPRLLQTQAAASPARPFDVFTPLVGHNWIAEFNDGKLTDSSRFEFVYDRQFVRNRHAVRTQDGQQVYEGETIYAWDARAQRIVWWYWNVTGGYLEGTVSVPSPHTLLEVGMNHGPASQLDESRARIEIAADHWTFVSITPKNGVWTDDPPRTYRLADGK